MPEIHELTKEFVGQPGGQGVAEWAEHDPRTQARRVTKGPFVPKMNEEDDEGATILRSRGITADCDGTSKSLVLAPKKRYRMICTVDCFVVLWKGDSEDPETPDTNPVDADETGTLFKAGEEIMLNTWLSVVEFNRVSFVAVGEESGKFNLTELA